jgi:succinate---hydroxymethylglutarate CoA-transferase
MALPLDGVRILDFTIMMQGPHGTMMLGDLGAEIVKVERPARLGGPSGRADERYGRHGGYGRNPDENTWYASSFIAHNRNKKSLTVDLKKPEGREVILRLVKACDVCYENFRPGAMERLGLGYEDCRKINPSIIYASATGYGPDGPYAHRPGQDLIAQALSGIASMNAPAGGRRRWPSRYPTCSAPCTARSASWRLSTTASAPARVRGSTSVFWTAALPRSRKWRSTA